MPKRKRLGDYAAGSSHATRTRARIRSVPARGTLLVLLLALLACGEQKACDPSALFAPTEADCANFAKGPWKVDLGGDEFQMGDSRRGSISPGLPVECADQLVSVAWSVEDLSVASVTPVGAKNARNDTAGDIARAWVTAVAPGVTKVKAQVSLSDGSTREAEPATLQVVEPKAPPRKSFAVAEGTVALTFNEFTGGGGADPSRSSSPAREALTSLWIGVPSAPPSTFPFGRVCVTERCPAQAGRWCTPSYYR